MRLFVYDMLVNVNVIYYVHVCEQARWARLAGNSAIEYFCIIIIIYFSFLCVGGLAIPLLLYGMDDNFSILYGIDEIQHIIYKSRRTLFIRRKHNMLTFG